MKKSPIADHKEKDAILMRDILLGIIQDDSASNKDVTEAVKSLARMHSLLQADRSEEKVVAKDDGLKKQTQKELNDRINAILNTGLGHSKGSDASS